MADSGIHLIEGGLAPDEDTSTVLGIEQNPFPNNYGKSTGQIYKTQYS